MIATRLGLAITVALACLLALVLALDVRRDTAPPDRALVSDFVTDRVTELAWQGRHIGTPIRLVRGSAGWAWVSPVGPADVPAVEAVLATLRGARWHRRAELSAAGHVSDRLTVTFAGGRTTEISIGQPLKPGEQQWLVIGDAALLVDGWVARSLVPDPVTLRVRAPLGRAGEATEIAVVPLGSPEFKLRGSPRRLVAYGEHQLAMLVASELVGELERALVGVMIVAVPAAPQKLTQRGMELRLDGTAALVTGGFCPDRPDHPLVDGPTGQGCVDPARWAALGDALAPFTTPGQPMEKLIERRLVPGEPSRVTLVDRTVLDLTKRPRIGDGDADPARVIELLAALATPGEPIAVPTSAPFGTLEVVARDGLALTLDLYAGHIVVRRGEPLGLQLGEGAHALLSRPGTALRDPTLWSEEPTTITKLALDATTYTRGTVLGEWTRTGPGRDDPAALDQLVGLLAAPRGLGPHSGAGGAGAAGAGPRVTLTITPPSGAPTTRTFTLVPRGCGAVVDRAAVQIAPAVCQLVARLTRR